MPVPLRLNSCPFPLRDNCPFGSLRSPQALPTETKVESRTSQSKSGTSVNLSNSGICTHIRVRARRGRSPQDRSVHFTGTGPLNREGGYFDLRGRVHLKGRAATLTRRARLWRLSRCSRRPPPDEPRLISFYYYLLLSSLELSDTKVYEP